MVAQWLRQHPLVFVRDLANPRLDRAAVDHLTRSLRLGVGDAIALTDRTGAWAEARLVTLRGAVEAEATHAGVPDLADGARRQPTTVAFAPTKGVKVEWVVQKLTEIGVERIVILRSDRSVVRHDEERLERLVHKMDTVTRLACQQSRRLRFPAITTAASVSAFLESTENAVLADPSGPSLANSGDAGAGAAQIGVGPEGGWSSRETSLAPFVRLPGHILRADTAVVAAGLAVTVAGRT